MLFLCTLFAKPATSACFSTEDKLNETARDGASERTEQIIHKIERRLAFYCDPDNAVFLNKIMNNFVVIPQLFFKDREIRKNVDFSNEFSEKTKIERLRNVAYNILDDFLYPRVLCFYPLHINRDWYIREMCIEFLKQVYLSEEYELLYSEPDKLRASAEVFIKKLVLFYRTNGVELFNKVSQMQKNRTNLSEEDEALCKRLYELNVYLNTNYVSCNLDNINGIYYFFSYLERGFLDKPREIDALKGEYVNIQKEIVYREDVHSKGGRCKGIRTYFALSINMEIIKILNGLKIFKNIFFKFFSLDASRNFIPKSINNGNPFVPEDKENIFWNFEDSEMELLVRRYEVGKEKKLPEKLMEKIIFSENTIELYINSYKKEVFSDLLSLTLTKDEEDKGQRKKAEYIERNAEAECMERDVTLHVETDVGIASASKKRRKRRGKNLKRCATQKECAEERDVDPTTAFSNSVLNEDNYDVCVDLIGALSLNKKLENDSL